MHRERKYVRMKKAGASAVEVFRTAKEDGLDWFACLNVLCKVFGFSPVEAKEITVRAEYNVSLDEHQQSFVSDLEADFKGKDEK